MCVKVRLHFKCKQLKKDFYNFIFSLGLVYLFYELLNEDRLLAASHNIRVMFAQGISDPIGPEM
jgi:hypothetical protein